MHTRRWFSTFLHNDFLKQYPALVRLKPTRFPGRGREKKQKTKMKQTKASTTNGEMTARKGKTQLKKAGNSNKERRKIHKEINKSEKRCRDISTRPIMGGIMSQ